MRTPEELPLSEEASAALTLKIKEQDTYLKKSKDSADSLDSAREKCKLDANSNYKIVAEAKSADNHYYVTLATPIPGCQLKSGYVFADHVSAPLSAGGEYCQYSWEQKPGTTDYTTYDE